VGVGVVSGQFTQNVLCFWGSWTSCSLKWKPCLFTGASPLAMALAIRMDTSMSPLVPGVPASLSPSPGSLLSTVMVWVPSVVVS
jgi:hypothetical protein